MFRRPGSVRHQENHVPAQSFSASATIAMAKSDARSGSAAGIWPRCVTITGASLPSKTSISPCAEFRTARMSVGT